MRKIFAFALFIFLSVNAFALDSGDSSINFEAEDDFFNEFWIVNRNIGQSFIIGLSDNEKDLTGARGFSMDWSYKQQFIYWPTGYVFQFEASQSFMVGKMMPSIDSNIYNVKFYGVGDTVLIGFGYAFARNKRCLATLAGCFGLNDSVSAANISYVNVYVVSLSLVVGLDFSMTFRFSKHLGAFASVFAGTSVIGGGFRGYKCKYCWKNVFGHGFCNYNARFVLFKTYTRPFNYLWRINKEKLLEILSIIY